MLQQFAKTLAAYRLGTLAYYDFDRLSTGPLEGTTNIDQDTSEDGLWISG